MAKFIRTPTKDWTSKYNLANDIKDAVNNTYPEILEAYYAKNNTSDDYRRRSAKKHALWKLYENIADLCITYDIFGYVTRDLDETNKKGNKKIYKQILSIICASSLRTWHKPCERIPMPYFADSKPDWNMEGIGSTAKNFGRFKKKLTEAGLIGGFYGRATRDESLTFHYVLNIETILKHAIICGGLRAEKGSASPSLKVMELIRDILDHPGLPHVLQWINHLDRNFETLPKKGTSWRTIPDSHRKYDPQSAVQQLNSQYCREEQRLQPFIKARETAEANKPIDKRKGGVPHTVGG